MDHMQTIADKAHALVARLRQQEIATKNRIRLLATFKEGD